MHIGLIVEYIGLMVDSNGYCSWEMFLVLCSLSVFRPLSEAVDMNFSLEPFLTLPIRYSFGKY